MQSSEKDRMARDLWVRVNKRVREIVDVRTSPNSEKLTKIAKNLRHTYRHFENISVDFDDAFNNAFEQLHQSFQTALGPVSDLRELFQRKDTFKEQVKKIIREEGTESNPLPHTVINVNDSQLNLGSGNNTLEKVGRDKKVTAVKTTPQKTWWKKPEVVIPIVIAIISIQWWPTWYHRWIEPISARIPNIPESLLPSDEVIATSTPNIKDILDKNFTYVLSSDQETFMGKHRDEVVHGSGIFKDSSKPGDMYYLYMYVGQYPIACSFNGVEGQIENKIQLLKQGDEVSFVGTFTGSGLWSTSRYVQDPWYIRDCYFI